MRSVIDDAVVARIARLSLDASAATITEHRSTPVDYDAYLPGRTITRVDGRAIVEGVDRTWSAILKWTDSPFTTTSAPSDRGRREALAYRSSLLARASGLSVPRVYEVELGDDGHVALWLEDVSDHGPEAWPISTYATAARALGQFNGWFVDRDVPDFDWLVQDWAERQSEPIDVPAALAEAAALAADERVGAALGGDIGVRASRMISDQVAFIDTLATLPQTLCHHDAARSNLVARLGGSGETEIVALDWESTGPGPLGADIATLVSGSLRKGDFPADRADELDAAVFEGYLDGLRDAGSRADRSVVRLGYAMSLALRCWFVRSTMRILTDPQARPVFGRARQVRHDQVGRAFILFSRFLLERVDEARSLWQTVNPVADENS